MGVGATGSNIAVLLARLGINKLHIWDPDVVANHNLTNQTYTQDDVGDFKIYALEKQLKQINPHIDVKKHERWVTEMLEGHVFICLDNIETGYRLIKQHQRCVGIDTMHYPRIRLEDAQLFAARWSQPDEITKLIEASNFTVNEALEATPVSACGVGLSVTPSVVGIACITVSNFMNYITDKHDFKIGVLLNTFTQHITTW